jgi:hypothetical protein
MEVLPDITASPGTAPISGTILFSGLTGFSYQSLFQFPIRRTEEYKKDAKFCFPCS